MLLTHVILAPGACGWEAPSSAVGSLPVAPRAPEADGYEFRDPHFLTTLPSNMNYFAVHAPPETSLLMTLPSILLSFAAHVLKGPIGAHRVPKGSPKEPKEIQKPPKGFPKGPKGSLKGPIGTQMATQ